MLLKSRQIYNRGRFSLREPGPDQVPIPRRCPDEVGVVIIHDPQWATNCDRNFFLRCCVQATCSVQRQYTALGHDDGFSPPLSWSGPVQAPALRWPAFTISEP